MRVAAVVLLLAAPSALAAQLEEHRAHAADSARRLTLGAMGVGVVTRATPAALGHSVTEGYLTQPMMFAGASTPRDGLQALVSVNLEGLTLARGEIGLGGYGEGYMDRRHPHTYLHELMVGATRGLSLVRVSIFAGKGFVPFGTDDPMTRPFVKYPVNHHLAQILEREVVTGALALGPVALEGARFNGDEPESPSDWPNRDRALDSWAARLTYRPARGVELSGSAARVLSPEFAAGGGLDQDKRSVAARIERHSGTLRYALVEWARTGETRGTRTVFRFSSLLAEGQAALGRSRVALRLERTERPEEDRSVNPYRSVRPLLDFSILGKTRWEIVTARVDAPPARWRRAAATIFVEGAWLRPRAVLRPTAVDPEIFYGASRLWMLSTGVRIHAGDMRARFGRYGAGRQAGS
ncbi:MAG: hypothetical protein ABIZ91_09315 [Gemmatimonadaceae bacterium]